MQKIGQKVINFLQNVIKILLMLPKLWLPFPGTRRLNLIFSILSPNFVSEVRNAENEDEIAGNTANLTLLPEIGDLSRNVL